jgi:hypothetical protein
MFLIYMERTNQMDWISTKDEFLQLAEAVMLEPPTRGRRRVKIIERGKEWVLYTVARDMWIKVAYESWEEVDYSQYVGSCTCMKINLREGCVAYIMNWEIGEAYRITERDIAGLVTIRRPRDLWDFIWRRLKEAEGRERCHRSPLFL